MLSRDITTPTTFQTTTPRPPNVLGGLGVELLHRFLSRDDTENSTYCEARQTTKHILWYCEMLQICRTELHHFNEIILLLCHIN